MTEISKSTGKDPGELKYMPQLDTLRTFAVFFVLLSHWMPKNHKIMVLPYGYLGVTLFFVLSGFLITEILLKSRNAAEESKHRKLHSIRQFYIRRTLRIFPIYYLTLIVLFIYNVNQIRDIIYWFIFYASNIYFFSIHNYAGYLSHLWTLAVEEQFYIIWPFIIFFIPKKYLLNSIIAIITIGPVFRAIMFFINLNEPGIYSFVEVLTPACIDSFGLGALLAYFKVCRPGVVTFNFKNNFLIIFVYIFCFTLIIFFMPKLVRAFFLNLNLSILFVFLISKASAGFGGFLKIIFENKILMYLGKISYGMYLYHKFIPLLYENSGLPPIQNLYFKLIAQGAMLVLMASLSWFLIEKPINSLKRKFDYV